MQPKIDIPISAHLELDSINHHTRLPDTVISKLFERVLLVIGNISSWIWIVLMAVIVINVLMRYVLGYGRIEFEELQWHLYAAGWLIGLSYCYVADDHVRVDLIHDRLTLKTQAWIEFLGIIFLLTPFILLVLWYSLPFIIYSWELGEVSGAPGGLPYRWIMKSVLFIGFALLLISTISRFSRICSLLFSSKKGTADKQFKV
ncbi:MAG: TRAP-type mannitol/chloroaromatic compound transport system permease small subunit [Colwellia sp.]|jgi:TRAP-type mannitol/chloroaromatic compound transport system permease small subunit